MSLLKRLGSESPAPPAAPSTTSAPTLTAPAPAPALNAPAPAPALGANAAPGGEAITQKKMLELSLNVTDRVLASFGSQGQIERNPETERLIQERFANYYRQTGATLGQEQIKALYGMVMSATQPIYIGDLVQTP